MIITQNCSKALSNPDYPAEKVRVILIAVEAFDWNSPQHLPIRYSEADVTKIKAPLEARIQKLEQQLTQLSSSNKEIRS